MTAFSGLLLAASLIGSITRPVHPQCTSCECYENCTTTSPTPSPTPSPPPTTYPPPPVIPPPPIIQSPPPAVNPPPPVMSNPPPSVANSPPPSTTTPPPGPQIAASPPPQAPPGLAAAPPPPPGPLAPAPYVTVVNLTTIAAPRFQLNAVDAALLALAQVDPATAFAQWQTLVGVSYATPQEATFRFNIFKQNVAYIVARKSTAPNLVLGLGYYSDVTNTEFQETFLGGEELTTSPVQTTAGRRMQQDSNPFQYANTVPLSQVDWNASGKVSAVMDQGNCNSCWAFASVGAVESINAIQTGVLTKLSEEVVMNCGKGSAGGCGENTIEAAFGWIHSNGTTTEANIPYNGLNGTCPYNSAETPQVTIQGYADVPTSSGSWDTGLPMSEYNLMQAVTNQPVALRIDAQSQDVQFYKDGYMTCPPAVPSPSSTNHFVELTGYSATVSPVDPKKILPGGYWIARNSWSKQWGQEGYFFLTMGESGVNGACNIAVGPNTYPLSNATTAPPGTSPSAPPPPTTQTTRIGAPLPTN